MPDFNNFPQNLKDHNLSSNLIMFKIEAKEKSFIFKLDLIFSKYILLKQVYFA